MRDRRRRVRLAAVDAAARAPRPWATLGALVDRLGDRDRQTAARAADAALAVTAVEDERALVAADLDPVSIAAIAKRAARFATDERLAPDVRAAGAGVAARLQAYAHTDAGPVVRAAADEDPSVRHALLDALRGWGPRLAKHRAALGEWLRDS